MYKAINLGKAVELIPKTQRQMLAGKIQGHIRSAKLIGPEARTSKVGTCTIRLLTI